jgi:alpha-beta hydrolase superfamily lysophospholipase
VSTVHGWAGDPLLRIAVELPEDARAGVVICAPLGQEGVIAYRALRLLAAELALRGVASVRYDPHGHGDSAPGAVSGDAVRSALEAADLLRAMGCAEPGFIGLASGALVAAEAAAALTSSTGAPAPLVVWDSPASGRSWLRRQRALATMWIATERMTDEFETLVGIDLTPAEIADLGAMRVASERGAPVLAAVRPGEAVPPGIADDADRIEVDGMAELLDGQSMRARIPRAAVEDITAWTAAHLETSDEPLTTPTLGAALVLDDGTTEVIRTFGPDRLFGIETVPADAAPDAPVVVLHNGASEHRVGAADYQVRLARELAADGVRVVRFDRRGTGEDGVVTADEPSMLYTDEWVADQDSVIADLAVPGDRLALVGMCSGAWLAARSVSHEPALVVEISPGEYRRTTAKPGYYQEALLALDAAGPLRVRLRPLWNRVVPERVRHVIDRRGRRGGVADQLRPLARAGTSVALLVGPDDARIFEELGGVRATRRLESVDIVRVEDGDHSLFSPRMREVVIAEVRQRVAAAFPHAESRTLTRT